jgi:hypothetical protein
MTGYEDDGKEKIGGRVSDEEIIVAQNEREPCWIETIEEMGMETKERRFIEIQGNCER